MSANYFFNKVYKWLLTSVFVVFFSIQSFSCHYSTFDFISYTNNLNGTYTITVQVCLAITSGYGGTTDFTITPSGGTFTSVNSVQSNTYTTSYCYNTFQTGGCANILIKKC